MMQRLAYGIILPLLCVAQLSFAGEGEKKLSWYCIVDGLTLFYGFGEHVNVTEVRMRSGEWGSWEGGPWKARVTLETGLAWWHSHNKGEQSGSHILDVSLTPVLRVERTMGDYTPFLDVGIGGHLITPTKIHVRKLSTAFQFGEHMGLGVAFGKNKNYEVGLAIRHISNGSIKKPNNGETYVGFATSYHF